MCVHDRVPSRGRARRLSLPLAWTGKGYLRSSAFVSISDCYTVFTDIHGGNAPGGGIYNDESGSILFEEGVRLEDIRLQVRAPRSGARIGVSRGRGRGC